MPCLLQASHASCHAPRPSLQHCTSVASRSWRCRSWGASSGEQRRQRHTDGCLHSHLLLLAACPLHVHGPLARPGCLSVGVPGCRARQLVTHLISRDASGCTAAATLASFGALCSIAEPAGYTDCCAWPRPQTPAPACHMMPWWRAPPPCCTYPHLLALDQSMQCPAPLHCCSLHHQHLMSSQHLDLTTRLLPPLQGPQLLQHQRGAAREVRSMCQRSRGHRGAKRLPHGGGGWASVAQQ
jgi:hypothetical protein